MEILVADVGGTNSRMALATEDGVKSATTRKYVNADFGSFYDIISEFLLDQNPTDLTAFCVAMAGPVSAGRGRLTNLEWDISSNDLKGLTKVSRVTVMNDLTALGHCVAHLPPQGITYVSRPQTSSLRNGQSLIVGMGTGFNLCPFVRTPSGATICLETEGGQVGLSYVVREMLGAEIGEMVSRFPTVEELFSGRGLARLHRIRTEPENEELRGDQIVGAHVSGTDSNATRTLQVYARILGAHCRELMLQYLPLDGLYFAGSVARGVLGSGLVSEFATEFGRHAGFEEHFSQVPIGIINDDAAALVGCAAVGRGA